LIKEEFHVKENRTIEIGGVKIEVGPNGFEVCNNPGCNNETTSRPHDHVDTRPHHIDGAGTFCKKCYGS
jgi:hypothetical protein